MHEFCCLDNAYYLFSPLLLIRLHTESWRKAISPWEVEPKIFSFALKVFYNFYIRNFSILHSYPNISSLCRQKVSSHIVDKSAFLSRKGVHFHPFDMTIFILSRTSLNMIDKTLFKLFYSFSLFLLSSAFKKHLIYLIYLWLLFSH